MTKEEEIKDFFKVGERVVIFSYTNTTPRCSGIITAVTEHFIEIEEAGIFKNKTWHPKTDAEIVLTQ